jgi:hypothetical protein
LASPLAGVKADAYRPEGDFLGASLEYRDNGVHVLLLIAFLFTIIRFAHGSILHLTALTGGGRWQWDMFGSLFQAILFFVLALTINKTSYFLFSFFLVLLIDSLWLFMLKPLGRLKKMEKNWLISNAIVFIIFLALYISYCGGILNNITIGTVAALCSMFAAFHDYYANSNEYFPVIFSICRNNEWTFLTYASHLHGGPLFTTAERRFNLQLAGELRRLLPAFDFVLPQERAVAFLPDLSAVVTDCLAQVRGPMGY